MLDRPYTTVDRVRAEILNEDTDILARIEDSINQASRYVEDFTKRDFWFHDHTITPYQIRPVGSFIFLPWPVITLTGITNSEGAEVDGTDIYFTADSGVIESVGFKGETKPMSLVGTFGYALSVSDPTGTPPPTCPASIVRATTLIAAAWSGEYKIERVSVTGDRVSIADSRVPSDAKMLLAPYLWKPV